MTCCVPAVINVPIGSDCAFGFVFKNEAGELIDLHGSEFIFTAMARFPSLTLQFETMVDPDNLYVQEDALIRPFGEDVFLADWLVLALTPDLSRQIPFGAMTHWEIERRRDGVQQQWGAGMFRGCGGLNPDV